MLIQEYATVSVMFKATNATNAQTIIKGSLLVLVSSFSDIFVLLSNSKIIYNCKFLSLKDCNCDEHGSDGAICQKENDDNGIGEGQCHCKPLVDGLTCTKCKDGYFGFLLTDTENEKYPGPDCQRKYYRPVAIEL